MIIRGTNLIGENNDIKRHGGVVYTIKDGIIFDAKQLLKDVEEMVVKAKADEDFTITQPGLDY